MPASVAVYVETEQSIAKDKLREIIGHDNFKIKKSLLGGITRVEVDWSDGTRAVINVMPSKDMTSHLQGFVGYVVHLLGGEIDTNSRMFLKRIQSTKQVLGVVFEPDWHIHSKDFTLGVAGYYLIIQHAKRGPAATAA